MKVGKLRSIMTGLLADVPNDVELNCVFDKDYDGEYVECYIDIEVVSDLKHVKDSQVNIIFTEKEM